MKLRQLIIGLGIILFIVGCSIIDNNQSRYKKEAQTMSKNLQFFKSLDYNNGLSVVTSIFRHFPLQYATTLGLDGDPQIRPLEFKFEEDGVLYFDTITFYTSFKEIQVHPYIQICIADQQTMTYIRLSGKVNFTTDQNIIEKCFENSPVLKSQFGSNRDLVIAYYLTNVTAEFQSFSKELKSQNYSLRNKYDE